MHLLPLLALALPSALLASAAPAPPAVEVHSAFPPENLFGHVTNGAANKISLTFVNRSPQNLTVLNVGGNFFDSVSGKNLANVTTKKFNTKVVPEGKYELPYTFGSELKPGEKTLKLWVEYADDSASKHRAVAHEGLVTVVEPPASWFDLQLLSVYLLLASLFSGVAYYVYSTYLAPAPAKSKKSSKKAIAPKYSSDPAPPVDGTKTYDDEWVPETAKLRNRRGKAKLGAASSGDELSGGETSGGEAGGKKKKGGRRK